MKHLSRSALSRSLLTATGWAVVCWVQFAWRLGYPSLWDPDEATYAEVTREMLAAHSWFVPLYDGRPFFDKPPLFDLLQITTFSVFGATSSPRASCPPWRRLLFPRMRFST